MKGKKKIKKITSHTFCLHYIVAEENENSHFIQNYVICKFLLKYKRSNRNNFSKL